ncbi:MAG: tape measure protein [Polaromonas sp.]|nr:tape measure protein [Polaromonas sp.]
MADTSIKFTLAVDDAQFKTAIDAAQLKTATMTGNMSRGFGSASAGVQGLSNQLASMGAIAAAAFSVNKIAALTDAYASLNARVALASQGVGSAAVAQQQLFEIAARSRVGVQGLSEVYVTLSRSASEMGASQSRVLGITETLSKAMTISGGSAESARAAMVQFGQGMNAGALRGEELNSVLEQAPRLAQALAEGMGQPVGALKTLAAEGKITTEVVFTALERMKGRIDAEFEQLPTTIGQAMTLIQNSLLQTIGVFDQANGISRGFADGLVVLSNNMDTAVVAAGSLAAAYVLLRISTTAATVASSALALATGALGGPIGLVVTALGLGAAAWVAWRAAGVNGEEAVKTKVIESHEDIIKRVDQQAAKLRERNQLAGLSIEPLPNQTALDSGKEYTDAYNKYQAVINRTGQFAGIPDAVRDDLIKSSGAKMANAFRSYSEFARDLTDETKRVTTAARTAFMADYQSGGDKLAKQLADYDTKFLGKVSAEQRNKDLAAIRAKAPKAAVDDTIKTAVDAQVALYEQLQITVTSGEKRSQEALTASRAAGLVQDQDFYTQKRDLALGANAGIQSLVNLEIKAVESSKLATKDKASAVVKYNGELTKLREDEIGINAKYNNELLVAAAELAKKYNEALSKVLGDGILKTAALNAETRALEAQTKTVRLHGIAIDSTATILAREEVANLSAALATTLHNKAIAEQIGLTKEQNDNFATTIAQLTALKNVATGTANASAGKDVAQAGLDQTERLVGNKVQDPFKDWGNTLRETFATAGDGLARMVSVMGVLAESGKEYAKEMSVINALRKEGGKSNLETASVNEQALIERTRKDQISAYASMAGAAKGFFKEGSDGYRLMSGIEQAAHLMQMANLAEKLFTSLFVSTTTATGVAAGQVAETAAVTLGEAERNVVKAPGVFMAFMSALGPWGMAAAAVAIAAVLGSMSKGGSAPSVSMDAFAGQAANTGTGTVLGDPTAQSESIQNSLDALEGYAKPSLLFTSQMVSLLRSINNSLAGATSSLLSSGFDAFGSQFQGSSSASGGGIIGSIFGKSSSSTSLSDLGLAFAKQTVGEAIKSLSLQQYEVTRTDSSSSGLLGFGSKSSTSYNTSMSAVDAKVAETMSTAVKQMFEIVSTAATQIGVTQDQIDALQSIDTGLSKISLKDKTGQEIQELLTAVFSAMGDTLAVAIAPSLKDMQLAGEGLLETLTRVTNGLTITNDWARIFGQSMFEMSLAGAKSANLLAEAFGGLENLNSQSQAFYEAFYTDAERAAESQSAMTRALASVNLTLPESKEAFRALAVGLDLTTESGRAAYAMMLSLAPTFSDTAETLAQIADDLATAATDALQKVIDTAQQGVSDAMAALGRAVDAERKTITSAYEAQSAAVQSSLDTVSASVSKLQSLSSILRSTLDGMSIAGAESANRSSAQATIFAALAQARSGGGLPLDGQLDNALRAVAQPSEQLYSTFEDYARDFYKTANDIAALAEMTDAALTADQIQQRQMTDQLALLKSNHDAEMTRLEGIISTAQAQIDAINAVNTSVLTVVQAIANLGTAINGLASANAAASAAAQAAAAAAATGSLGAAGGGDGWANSSAYAHGSGVSVVPGDSDLITAAKLVYQSAVGGVSTSQFNAAAAAVGGDIYGATGWNGDPESFRALYGFAAGTNSVPYDMTANIHAGERIIPAADNRLLMARLSSPQGSSELIAEVRALRAEVQGVNEEMKGLRIEAQASASNTNKTARLLERAMPNGTAIAVEAVTS